MMRSPSPLPDDVREKSGEKINDVAIDLLGLASVARKAHWNVRGPLFGQLHDLFGELYDEASKHADTLAEHAAMLGVSVRGDHVETASGAVAEPLGDEHDGLALCSFLFDQVSATIVEIQKAHDEIESNIDGQQLLSDTSIALSNLGWMIGAYLEDEAKGPKTEKVSRSEPPKAPTDND